MLWSDKGCGEEIPGSLRASKPVWYHRLGNLNRRNLLFLSLEVRVSKIKVKNLLQFVDRNCLAVSLHDEGIDPLVSL